MTAIDVPPGATGFIPFCCEEMADGGAQMNSSGTGVLAPQDGVYAVRFAWWQILDPHPVDWTHYGMFIGISVVNSSGVVVSGVRPSSKIIGEGSFEINSHFLPVRNGESVCVTYENFSDTFIPTLPTTFTIDNYELEVAYRGLISDESFCNHET